MEARTFSQRMQAAHGRKQSDTFYPRGWWGIGSWFFNTARTSYNYAADVGIGLQSSVLMATVQWLMRAFPEAPMVVRRQRATGLEIVPRHPLAERIAQPNAFYSGEQLWMATVWSWCIFGNAYWLVIQDRRDTVRELWWVPPWMIMPEWPPDGRVFISHYTYTPTEGASRDLSIAQVVHFRHGIDPRNMRLGLSPVAAVLREIWSDDEATNWVAALLRNMGIPGMVITPEGDAHLADGDTEVIKAYISSRFTGDHRGEPMAFDVPVRVQKLAYSPSEMDMSLVHNTAEERVTSMFGVPAAVVGFGTGLESTKVGATMAEMVRLAWTNGVIPPQRIIAGEIDRVLLPKYERDPLHFRTGWDYGQVQALQEDENKKAERWAGLLQRGVAMRSEARRAMGLEAEPSDEVYLLPISVIESGPGATSMLPPAPVPRNGNGNGHGQPVPDDEDEAEDEDGKYLKQGSVEELIQSLLSRHSPRLDHPPPMLLRLVTRLFREQAAFEPRASALVETGLRRLGQRVAESAAEILEAKQDLQAFIDASRIVERFTLLQLTADLTLIYEQLYEYMAQRTLEAMVAALDLEPFSVERILAEIQAAAARRVAGLNLPTEIRTRVQRIIEEGRIAGLTDRDLVDQIAEQIPRGRYRDVQIRATILSRTELRHSMNATTLAYAQQQGMDRLLVLDARLGATDQICEARNGLIITLAEAQLILPFEHPNGTLAFAPLSAAMLADIGATV